MAPLLLLLALATVQVLNDLDQALKSAAHPDPEHRIRSLPPLLASKDPRSRTALLGLLGDEHPKVRLRTARAILDSADPLSLLRPALRHSSPKARRQACDALADCPLPDAGPLLLERLSDGDPHVQGAAAAALGRRADPAAVPRLLEAFQKDRDWPLRAFALESVARLAPDRLPELLDPAAADPNYQVRLAAAATGLAKLVSDRDWRVRATAIDACRRRRDRESIGLLVEQFPYETGRLRWDILTALQDLSGKSLGLDPKPWAAWWSAVRDSYAVRPAAPGGKPPPAPGETQAAFFKVPILSTRILFVLDLSGSMRDPSPEGGTKLDVAKKGMIDALRSLPPDARFGILGLGCDAEGGYLHREQKTWQGRPVLVPAHAAGKADAERFVRGLAAKGWTNLYDGLDYAFSDPDVDTIYLYSDGGASKGTFVAAGEILGALSALNQFRRIVIHSVEVPGERNPQDNRRLLQKIADLTGGTCTLHEKK